MYMNKKRGSVVDDILDIVNTYYSEDKKRLQLKALKKLVKLTF